MLRVDVQLFDLKIKMRSLRESSQRIISYLPRSLLFPHAALSMLEYFFRTATYDAHSIDDISILWLGRIVNRSWRNCRWNNRFGIIGNHKCIREYWCRCCRFLRGFLLYHWRVSAENTSYTKINVFRDIPDLLTEIFNCWRNESQTKRFALMDLPRGENYTNNQ